MESTQEALTFRPRTEPGQEMLRQLGEGFQAVAESPVGEFVGDVSERMKRVGRIAGPLRDIAPGVNVALSEAAPTALAEAIPGGAVVRRGARAVDVRSARGVDVPRTPERIEPTATFREAAPEIATPESVDEIIATIKTGKPRRIAEEVRPDIPAQEAAQRLDIDLGPESLSTNPAFIEATQALKSQPGSTLAAKELENIAELNQRSEALIEELGGSLDRSVLDASLRDEMTGAITGLEQRANKLYSNVRDAIDARSPVDVSNSRGYIENRLADLGGRAELLNDAERQLSTLLSGEVTYSALDTLRRQIGNGFNKRSGPFKDDDEGTLKRVYAQLSEDQQRVAESFGVGNDYALARNLVSTRKNLEDASIGIFGRDLRGSIVNKTRLAASNLAKGDLSSFKKLMDAVPEHRRGDVATQVLDQLFTSGTRQGTRLGQGFSNTFQALNRNKGALNAIFKELPASARKRFDDIGKVTNAIFRAKSRENVSRTARDVLAALDNPSTLSRAYGLGTIAVAETATTTIGFPGAGTVVALARKAAQGKTPRSVATDRLLTSPQFQKALFEVDNVARANQTIQRSPAFQIWLRTLDGKDARDVLALGFIGWLSSEDTTSQVDQ